MAYEIYIGYVYWRKNRHLLCLNYQPVLQLARAFSLALIAEGYYRRTPPPFRKAKNGTPGPLQ